MSVVNRRRTPGNKLVKAVLAVVHRLNVAEMRPPRGLSTRPVDGGAPRPTRALPAQIEQRRERETATAPRSRGRSADQSVRRSTGDGRAPSDPAPRLRQQHHQAPEGDHHPGPATARSGSTELRLAAARSTTPPPAGASALRSTSLTLGLRLCSPCGATPGASRCRGSWPAARGRERLRFDPVRARLSWCVRCWWTAAGGADHRDAAPWSSPASRRRRRRRDRRPA